MSQVSPGSSQKELVLIVEDEPKIAALLEAYLQQRGGFATAVVDRGDAVLDWVRSHQPDLVLLDLMLPGRDGLEVCRELRRLSPVPIIMLTARVEEIDRLLGLELGADDYISKPFSPREVVARVRAVLRRSAKLSGDSAPRAGLKLDADRFEARLNGRALNLTPVEMALLKVLAAHPGRVLSRDQLMNAMYRDYRVVNDRAVDTHVKNLRRKLAEAVPGVELIESVYGVGYRLAL